MAKMVGRIIQISDLHIFSNPQTRLLGVNAYFSFVEVMNNITTQLASFRPDFVFLTGDVAQDFAPTSYEIVNKFLIDLPSQCAAILGNHDDPMIFAKYLCRNGGMTNNKVFITHNWKIVLLNSHWDGHVAGKLSVEELGFLQRELESSADKNVLIFLHHHALPVGSSWLDKIGLSNAQQFLDIIDGYDNIKAIISGHVHQETLKKRNNIAFITTPSTSWQFATFSPGFKLDDLMPGYRRIELYDDGSFKTEVIRLAYDKKFLPDKNSTGY